MPAPSRSEPSSKAAEPLVKAWVRRLAQAGWRAWAMGAVLALSVGTVLVWSGANLIHADPPPAVWTPEDLPALPAPEDNGWQIIHDRAPSIRPVSLRPVHQAVRSWLDADPAIERPTPEVLAAAEQSLARDDVATAAEACRAALDRPSFADACPLEFGQECPVLETAQCHWLVSFFLLQQVSTRRWARVGAGLEQLVAHGRGHLATARSAVGMLVALRNMRETLRLGGQLWVWAEADGASDSLAAARRQLEQLEPERVDASTAVIAEYLRALRGAVQIDRGELDTADANLPRFLFDAGATMAELNGIYGAARGPSGAVWRPALPPRAYAEGFGWWVRNPLGKLYLDAVLPLGRAYESVAAERESLVQAHARLLAALAAP